MNIDLHDMPRSFAALHELRELRPIKDVLDFRSAQSIADALAVLDHRTRDQDEYLESLSLLMEHYEDEHSPIHTDHLTPIEMLKYLMEMSGMSESDLGRLLGERSLGNAVLSGRRSLSKSHIRALADHFKVSADLFL
jgi:HTH-type transcriptional regulator/antitoxin HigA